MNLSQILEEISVGFRNTDEQSIKLKRYANAVRESLSKEGAVIEYQATIINETEGMFYQGSFGTETAVKHPKYEVDADIGYILGNIGEKNVRDRVYTHLQNEFPKYMVELKKPCITIDFKDGYKIDVAIYSDYNENLLFHNSIQGAEGLTPSKPKELVKYLKEEYAREPMKRDLIRLLKHFIKITSETLDIPDYNRIPSIAINLFIAEQQLIENGENLLERNLNSIVENFYEYIQQNGYNGPSKPDLYVTNTFYKVKDVNDLLRVLNKVKIHLQDKQYSEIISERAYKNILEKESRQVNPSLVGTLG